MAWVTAWRITGSPLRATSRRSTPARSAPSWSSAMTRPVSMRAQVEALTNRESLLPRCLRQSASASLSLIKRVAVSASGMRRRASARHMRTTPSGLESSYSWRKASNPPCPTRAARTLRTRSPARRAMRSRISGGNSAALSKCSTTSLSSARYAARTRERNRSAGGTGSLKIMGEVFIAFCYRLAPTAAREVRSLAWDSRFLKADGP